MVAVAHERQKIGPGLGASEVAAAVGLSPWQSPLTLWEEKTGKREPFAGNDFTEWGLLVEPALLAWYEQKHIDQFEHMRRPTESLYHPDIRWARCTPDGIVSQSDDWSVWLRGVQCKNTGFWPGKKYENGPPEHVVLQCQWEMFVTALPRVDVVAAIGGGPPAVFTVWRDEGLIADLYTAAAKFWHLVETDTPPPVDASDAWREHFAKKIGDTSRGLVLQDSADADRLAMELRSTRAARRGLEMREKQLENQICGLLADAQVDAVGTTEGLITWRESAGSTKWKDVAHAIAKSHGMAPTEVEALASGHRGEPKRTFNVPRSWDSKE